MKKTKDERIHNLRISVLLLISLCMVLAVLLGLSLGHIQNLKADLGRTQRYCIDSIDDVRDTCIETIEENLGECRESLKDMIFLNKYHICYYDKEEAVYIPKKCI